MVIQKTPIKVDKIVSLRIGQHQENAATQIKMDVSDWITVHPTAGFHILFKRPGEVQAQPVLSSLEDGILTWTVQAWETALIGIGYAEVRAVEAESALVAKSRVIPCSVEDSIIEDDAVVPPAFESWVNQVLSYKDDAEAAQEAAEAAQEAAETAQGLAEDAKDAAVAAQQASVASQTAAAGSAADALTYMNAAASHATAAEGHSNQAQTYKNAAEASAQDASDSADAAQGYAETASSKAEEAAGSATAAAGSAQDASTAKTMAVNAEIDAVRAAQSASESAGVATQRANSANSKAAEAAASARSASESATQADASADTASVSAAEAATSAQTATGKASEAATSAQTATQKAGEAATSAQEAQDVLDSIPSDYSTLSDDVTDLKSAINDAMGAYPTINASGNFISTPSGANNIPVDGFTAIAKCMQPDGTPTLSARKFIRPHYYMDVVTAKKNLFGGIAFATAVKKANPTAVINTEDKTVTMMAISQRPYVSGLFKFNTRYSIIFYGKNTTTTTSTNVNVIYTDGTAEQLGFSSSTTEAFSRYYSLEGKTILSIEGVNANSDAIFYYDKFGIFEGNVSVDDFVPFDGEAYRINFPDELSAVYGAKIQKTSAEQYTFVVTHKAINMGLLTWTATSIDNVFMATLNTAKYQGDYKCECYEYVKIQDISELQKGQIASTNSQELNIIRVRDTNYSTAENFTSAVNGKLLVYELYEPVVYTVSGDEIKTILGENNIFTNVGSISEIGVRNDTVLYVNSKLPDLEKYGIPVIYFNGEIADMTKSNEKKLSMSYHSPNTNYDCYVKMKWQGTSSLAYPKKNYTIKLYSDASCSTTLTKDMGWGAESKYCLKANWIDFSMARNICSAKLWGRIVKNRTGVSQKLSALPNGGAIDGFPCAVVINGEYTGLYTFNIPKDGWMLGMGSSTTEAIVCADGYGTATQFNQLAELDGSDFKLEYDGGAGLSAIKTSLNTMIQSVIDATAENFDSTVGQYLDIDSAIDYYIFTCMLGGGDMVEKNYLLATYDGTKWFFSAYDMDTTFGLAWDGSEFSSAYSYPMFATYTEHNLLMDKLYDYKLSAIKTRYVALRQFLATDFNFQTIVYKFMKGFPKGLKDREVNMWAGLPSTDVSNAAQITTWFSQRLKLLDVELNVTP